MAPATRKPADLKEACIQAAHEVIAEEGVEGLSLRDVARKLNISHQAPYRHFASRDHLLAEIMRRCFVDFSAHLEQPDAPAPAGQMACEADDALGNMGYAYLAYAAAKPLEYRLMFGTPWPEPAQHPALVQHAVHAFDLLRTQLRKKHGDVPRNYPQADLDALFIWSTLHGMASITQANVMEHLVLAPGVTSEFTGHIMGKIGAALAAPAVAPPGAAPRKSKPGKKPGKAAAGAGRTPSIASKRTS